jgi:exodeoxyribonuclease VII large subunit
VVRAVFASSVPVVTGVGHATDRTLVEDVADVYAPTPSAAAEVCVPSIEELADRLLSLESRLIWSLAACRANSDAALHAASRRLVASCPVSMLRERRSGIATVALRMRRAVTDKVSRDKQSVTASGQVLTALDPIAVLQRGYAALQHSDNALPIFSVAQAEPGTRIVARLADGALKSSVDVVLPRLPTAVVSS